VGSHTGRLDIVVTDLGMPGMDGYELGRRLREARPGLPILYVSGYGDAEGAGPILRKPFAPDVLVREVGELLRQSVER
jgi:DNA-binding response OmpR family regulator